MISPSVAAAPRAFSPLMGLRSLQAFVLVSLVAKLAFAVLTPPNSDEAYYFMWGRHLQWSYRDHAPMVGWMAAWSGDLIGWTPLGLRAPTLLGVAAALGLFILAARHLAPTQAKSYFWTLAGVYLASPMFIFATTNALPDYTLIPFLLAAAFFLARFLADWRAARTGAFADLYLAALFMGLAGLSKYNAAFFFAAAFAFILSRSDLRGLFREKHFYGAILLTAVLVSPVLVWNFHHHFSSVAFHAGERFQGSGKAPGFTPFGLLQEGGAVLAFGPLLMPALYRFLRQPAGDDLFGVLHGLGKWCFWISTLFMLALACWAPASGHVAVHWSDVGFVPFLLLAPFFIRRAMLFAGHVALGCGGFAVVALLYFANPLPMAWFGAKPLEPNRYGNDVAARAVIDAQKAKGAEFIAALDWLSASRLSFAAGPGHAIVPVLGDPGQFAAWSDDKALVGKDAILYVYGDADHVDRAPFDSLTRLDQGATTRWGAPMNRFTVFLARGYRGAN